MEVIAVLLIHGLITYCFARLVEREGVVIAFTWLNVGLAVLTGNPFFSAIDIAAVFGGGVLGKIHKDEAALRNAGKNPPQASQQDYDQARIDAEVAARLAEAAAYREKIESAPSSDSSSGALVLLVVIVVVVVLVSMSGNSPRQPDQSAATQPVPSTVSSQNRSGASRTQVPPSLPKGDLSHCRELKTKEEIIRCAEQAQKR